jgi:hypothetical protein
MLDAKAVCKKQNGLACDHILCSDLNVKARIQQNAGPLNWSMAGTDGWSQEKLEQHGSVLLFWGSLQAQV